MWLWGELLALKKFKVSGFRFQVLEPENETYL